MGKAMQNKTICVMGLGYIGLPTASVLATRGYDVVGIDVKKEIVDAINEGKVHIVEPDLAALVRNAVNVSFTVELLRPSGPGPFPLFLTQTNHRRWGPLL